MTTDEIVRAQAEARARLEEAAAALPGKIRELGRRVRREAAANLAASLEEKNATLVKRVAR